MSSSPIIIPSVTFHLSTLIFIHGLEDSAQIWVERLGIMRLEGMRVVVPSLQAAPKKLIPSETANRWLDLNQWETDDELKISVEKIHGLIHEEIKAGVRPEKIFLGGASQGGALALSAALSYPGKLGGVIGLMCWLPSLMKLPEDLRCDDIKILLIHGDDDDFIARDRGFDAFKTLADYNLNVEFKSNANLAHCVPKTMLDDCRSFMENILQSLEMPSNCSP